MSVVGVGVGVETPNALSSILYTYNTHQPTPTHSYLSLVKNRSSPSTSSTEFGCLSKWNEHRKCCSWLLVRRYLHTPLEYWSTHTSIQYALLLDTRTTRTTRTTQLIAYHTHNTTRMNTTTRMNERT